MLSHRAQNDLHTILLIFGMVILLSVSGYLLFGVIGLLILVAGGAFFIFGGQSVSPKLVLRMYKAKPVAVEKDTQLFVIVEELVKRAGLTNMPQLYYIPSKMINAFATGSRENALIGITDGILRALNGSEIAAVLAHEISHIKNNDIRVMRIADMISRVTHFLSGIGQLLLLINLPLVFSGQGNISWFAIGILIFAPNIAALMQLGLSRAREYDADLGAAELTQNPRALASALEKIERLHAGLLQKIMLPGRKVPEPSLLRTHPHTSDRIERLMLIEEKLNIDNMTSPSPLGLQSNLTLARETPTTELPQKYMPTAGIKLPRWHLSGLWY